MANWDQITAKRYVAFFDILGFKDTVLKNTHTDVLKKLQYIKKRIIGFEALGEADILKKYSIAKNQTRSFTFSDSIIFFSRGETFSDMFKILLDSYATIKIAVENGVAIKGGLSYGEITVDFDNSLFFGQPIIDAYLLHEELQMITAILDNNIETKLNSFPPDDYLSDIILKCKVALKCGKITHSVILPTKGNIEKRIGYLEKLYNDTYGKPRLYIDNTIDCFTPHIPIKKASPLKTVATKAAKKK